MNIYFLHSSDPITTDSFNEAEHIRFISLMDGKERIFHRKQMIHAREQMESIQKEGITTRYGTLAHRNNIAQFIRSGINFRKAVKHTKSDLVHVTWGTFSSFLAVLFSPVPVVISFCGSDLLGSYNKNGVKNIRSKLSVLLSQLSAFGAKKIIVKSEKLKQALWPFNKHKIAVIPNGVNLDAFHPIPQSEARERLGWKNNHPVILFFAGIGQTVKNKPLADATFEIIRQSFPDTELKLVQGVPHYELTLYYNAADILLLTSFHEGSNNSLKEAIACNLPVVSVDCGDSKERLLNIQPSYVAKHYDAHELANAVIAILKKRIRSNGISHIGEISEPVIARKIINYYQSVLNKKVSNL